MLTTGQQIEQLERQKNLAPFQALQQFGSVVSPIASGLPVQQTQTNNNPNIFTQALGNKIGGDDYGTLGGVAGAIGGVLAGLL